MTPHVGHVDKTRPSPEPPWDQTSSTREKNFTAELLPGRSLLLPPCARDCGRAPPASPNFHNVRLLTLLQESRGGVSGHPSNSTINCWTTVGSRSILGKQSVQLAQNEGTLSLSVFGRPNPPRDMESVAVSQIVSSCPTDQCRHTSTATIQHRVSSRNSAQSRLA